jgi:hypothetical protein
LLPRNQPRHRQHRACQSRSTPSAPGAVLILTPVATRRALISSFALDSDPRALASLSAARTRGLVGRSNQLLASLLAHLGEPCPPARSVTCRSRGAHWRIGDGKVHPHAGFIAGRDAWEVAEKLVVLCQGDHLGIEQARTYRRLRHVPPAAARSSRRPCRVAQGLDRRWPRLFLLRSPDSVQAHPPSPAASRYRRWARRWPRP